MSYTVCWWRLLFHFTPMCQWNMWTIRWLVSREAVRVKICKANETHSFARREFFFKIMMQQSSLVVFEECRTAVIIDNSCPSILKVFPVITIYSFAHKLRNPLFFFKVNTWCESCGLVVLESSPRSTIAAHPWTPNLSWSLFFFLLVSQ